MSFGGIIKAGKYKNTNLSELHSTNCEFINQQKKQIAK